MHVLTKIFIVLVSLLAVLLVPLVAVYTHNENSYKEKYLEAKGAIASANQEADSANARASSSDAQRVAEISDLNNTNTELRNTIARLNTDVRELQGQLASSDAFKGELTSKLTTLASALETGQELNENLVTEAKGLRSSALESERRRVELDEELRDVSSQLEVAVEARRALQEELQRMNTEQARALDLISDYVAVYGTLSDEEQRDLSIQPTLDLTTQILRVERSADRTLVEIAVGERDGVRENWGMVISDGGSFIGNLRITKVDVNSAIGEVTLEDITSRGAVAVGQTVRAYKGR